MFKVPSEIQDIFAEIPIQLSSEHYEKLEIYRDLLLRWQNVKNLVSAPSLDRIWLRHFADSAQLLRYAPKCAIWLDMGSGAGFPGIVVAILGSGSSSLKVRLIESDQRKCAFLREVSRETGANTEIICSRIEESVSEFTDTDVLTARALAPLRRLLEYGRPVLEAGAMGLFLKGKGVERELSEVSALGNWNIMLKQSITDRAGKIAVVRSM